MKKEKKPIEYGRLACEAIMHQYQPQDLPPKNVFFYHQGVMLSGMQNIYFMTGERKYFDYIKAYCDSVLGPNGELMGFVHELTKPDMPHLTKCALQTLDHKQPTILLYNLYDETGDEKYINAIKFVAESMYYWPVNQYGGYWHMRLQPNQMWLDGAYMAGPLSVMYSKRFGNTILRDRAVNQVFIMDDFMKDRKSGLYFHGWDDSKKMPWSDSESGLSAQIWGRAVGWYAVAILDILEYLPINHPGVPRLMQIERDLLKSLMKVQDLKTGMWYEVLDKPEKEDNWVESSCSNLFIYSYAKAIRMGVVSKEEFGVVLEKAYKGSIDSLYLDEEGYLVIDYVCEGTNIKDGTYEHYINRKQKKNDLHGVGAFILMCAEMQRYRDFEMESED